MRDLAGVLRPGRSGSIIQRMVNNAAVEVRDLVVVRGGREVLESLTFTIGREA